MSEIRRYPVLRHFRGDPTSHILRYRGDRLVAGGRGLAFWFHPLNTSIVAVPTDDRELPFLFHGRSRDFQDSAVQGVITYRVGDPEALARRIDFSVDLVKAQAVRKPLERIAGLLTELAQQFAWAYLAHSDLQAILRDGVEEIRARIESGLGADASLPAMGLEIVSVRVGSIRPAADLEKALQTPTREVVQQQADQASFQRRALAVEKERAIRENELQSEIELARREQNLIEQQGRNGRRRALETARSERIEARSAALGRRIAAKAEAGAIAATEGARVAAETDRMAIYRDMPSQVVLGLAARELAGKLSKIEHLNLTPDLLSGLLGDLAQAGTRRLEAGGGK